MKLHTKGTLVFLLAFLIVLSGLFFSLDKNIHPILINNIENNLKEELTLSKRFIQKEASPKNFDQLCDIIAQSLSIRVTIIDSTGVVLGDSEKEQDDLKTMESHLYRQEVQEALKTGYGKRLRYSTTIREKMLYMAMPVQINGQEYIVRVAKLLTAIDTFTNKIKEVMLGAFVIAFIFSLAIGILSSYFISRPIRKMSFIARNVAYGDYSDHMPISQQDEIGDLAKSLKFMTQQIRQQIEEVTKGRSKLEAVFLSMFDGIMITDSTGKIILANDAFKQMFKTGDNILDKNSIEVIRNVDITNIVNDILEKDSGIIVKEVDVLLPKQKNILIHAALVKREKEKEGAVLIFHDVTQTRHLEQIRKDFVANVSHELRTPIAKIRAAAETLQDGAIEEKKAAKNFLDIIYGNSIQLSNLINDLLDLAKIESNILAINKEDVNINEVISQTQKAFQAVLDQKHITLSINLNKIETIKADKRYIYLVFFNLIDNAIKYSGQNAEIAITAYKNSNNIQINVSDNGIGIPPEHIDRLFERFYRVDKSRSQGMGGTGLGLALVKHIIKAHNGDISVNSELHKGATFSFTLPIS